MLEYLQSLSTINQVLLSVAIGVGLSNSLPNYLKYFIAICFNKSFKQSDTGRIIDWCWLSIVVYLIIILM